MFELLGSSRDFNQLSAHAATAKYQRLGGSQTTDIYISQFWRLEVQDQSANKFSV